jgi:hypothetical protein
LSVRGIHSPALTSTCGDCPRAFGRGSSRPAIGGEAEIRDKLKKICGGMGERLDEAREYLLKFILAIFI